MRGCGVHGLVSQSYFFVCLFLKKKYKVYLSIIWYNDLKVKEMVSKVWQCSHPFDVGAHRLLCLYLRTSSKTLYKIHFYLMFTFNWCYFCFSRGERWASPGGLSKQSRRNISLVSKSDHRDSQNVCEVVYKSSQIEKFWRISGFYSLPWKYYRHRVWRFIFTY